MNSRYNATQEVQGNRKLDRPLTVVGLRKILADPGIPIQNRPECLSAGKGLAPKQLESHVFVLPDERLALVFGPNDVDAGDFGEQRSAVHLVETAAAILPAVLEADEESDEVAKVFRPRLDDQVEIYVVLWAVAARRERSREGDAVYYGT